jgi:hypothetical protein
MRTTLALLGLLAPFVSGILTGEVHSSGFRVVNESNALQFSLEFSPSSESMDVQLGDSSVLSVSSAGEMHSSSSRVEQLVLENGPNSATLGVGTSNELLTVSAESVLASP